MAMMDYGAVVKKNGKIISDVKGDLFQNFTNLKYVYQEEYPYDILVDETIVSGKDWKGNSISYSMAGDNFALIGDEHFLIGFYKTTFTIAIDKVVVDLPFSVYDWFDEHVKPITFKINNEISVKVSLVQKEHTEYGGSMQVFLAQFEYKNDNYEVLFGYGIDPSLIFTFTDKNYYHHKRKDCWHKLGKCYVKRGNYFYP